MLEIQGILFVKDASQLIAILAMAIGVFISFFDITENQKSLRQGRCRESLRVILGALKVVDWLYVPSMVIGAATRLIFGYVFYWFGLSKNNYLPVGLFLLLIFFAVPLAILTNLFQEGASWFLDFLLSIIIASALLLLFGGNTRVKFFNSLLAVYLYVAVFILLPGYFFVTVTGRILLMPTEYAAIASLLAMPILYILCYSLNMLVDKRSQLLSVFIAAVPISYIFTFVAFIAGHLATPAYASGQNWSLLLGSLFFSSLSLTVFSVLVRLGSVVWSLIGSFVVGVISSYLMLYVELIYGGTSQAAIGAFNGLLGREAHGDSYTLSPIFWVTHLPLVPCFVVFCFVLLSWIAKTLIVIEQKIGGGSSCISRPFLMTGAFLITSGGLLIIAMQLFST